jgi:hypothetical protein
MQFQIDHIAGRGCANSTTNDPQAKVYIDVKLKCVARASGADQSAVAGVLKEVGFSPRPAT